MRVVGILSLFACASSDSWADFKRRYNKSYGSDGSKRQAIFQANSKLAAAHNSEGRSWTQGVTQFSDLTEAEFKARHLCGLSGNVGSVGAELAVHRYSGTVLPESVDWRSAGAVTHVKDQASCGSCWAFSTTGSLEGRWQIASGRLVPLSEQQLVDCDHDWDYGCGGGEPEDSMSFAQKTDLCIESSYPYIVDDAQCHAAGCEVGLHQGSITGHILVDRYDKDAMMEAVSEGPVSVGVDAMLYQRYTGGILDDNCGTSIDHAVLLVGYGSESSLDYWLVKNSWGDSWGETGYIRMCRGCGMSSGECGILKQGVYPVMASAFMIA